MTTSISATRPSGLAAVALFSLTLFVSATLMFVLQPMFGKLLLPLLGGAPSVWNTCMVFYQAILFCGYLYAHFVTRRAVARQQILIHAGLILLSLILLPIGLPESVTPPTEHDPTLWLIGTLSLAIGLPLFVVSTLSPLIQHWFAQIEHGESEDPYFLYAASNAGSLLALLSYPLLIEPNIGVHKQTMVWSMAYGGLALLVLACALLRWKSAGSQTDAATQRDDDPSEASAAQADAAPIPTLDWPTRLRWGALAFVPSSLLLGVTNYISTDVAAVPLLWIIPLALYLLSFVVVFSRIGLRAHPWLLKLQPMTLLPFIAFAFINPAIIPYWLNLLLHLLAFFVAALVCHGELALSRPHARDLTYFYLIMAFAGMLGGFFNTFIAPFIFNSVAEYPIMIVAALLLRPASAGETSGANWQRYLQIIAFPLATLIIGLIVYVQTDHLGPYIDLIGTVLLLLTGLLYATRHVPLTLALSAGVLLFLTLTLHQVMSNTIEQERTFFGVLSVRNNLAPDPDNQGVLRFREVWHGTTKHGAQNLDPKAARDPLNYYSRPGPIGQLFKTYEADNNDWHVGVVGLGAGALACYAKPGQRWDFFELDPEVIRVASDPGYFTYLSSCAPQARMIAGDARLSLTQAADQSYDLLVLDAFSSDAIPTHLLTAEALALYVSKLKPQGLLAFHITNRHLELKNVLAGLAKQTELHGLLQAFKPAREIPQIVATDWVVLTQSKSRLDALKQSRSGHWRQLPLVYNQRVWSDDFTNIISVWKSTE